MPERIMKYNPAFLTKEQLIESFVVRLVDLELILQTIGENTAEVNRHILVVGPRGIGKTTLVLRVAAEIERNPEFKDKWYPIVFSEEGYKIFSPGELWLRALLYLADQTGEKKWMLTHDELMEEKDEARLRDRALAQLMDFADERGRRLLIIIENLNQVLGEQISDKDAWAIRHTLQNEPRIMLLGSAVSRFEEIENSKKAMYEQFKVHDLKPLNDAECLLYWKAITGQELTPLRIRPIKILTGGNPRLLAIISSFAARPSLDGLQVDLVQLVDEHTEYFKSHLDNLAPLERKVFVTLLEIWQPATASQVAKAARLQVSETSAFLNRLVQKGAVEVVSRGKRKHQYQVLERLYNIYYLMRSRGRQSGLVKAVVYFMVSFYEETRLLDIACTFTQEACGLGPDQRINYYLTIQEILEQKPGLRDKLIQAAPREFFEQEDVPEGLLKLMNLAKQGREASPTLETRHKTDIDSKHLRQMMQLLEKAQHSLNTNHDFSEVEEIVEKAIEVSPNSSWAWLTRGISSALKEDFEGAERSIKKALEIDSKMNLAWFYLGRVWQNNPQKYNDAENAYQEAIKLKPHDESAWLGLGKLWHLRLGKLESAEKAYGEVLKINPRNTKAMFLIIKLYYEKRDDDKALQLARKFLNENDNPILFNNIAWLFCKHSDPQYLSLAESWAREAVKKKPDDGNYQHTLASILGAEGKWEEALEAAEKFLADVKMVEKCMPDVIDFFVGAAAAGHARRALALLRESASAMILQPLIVGLQLMIGEKVVTAQEIMEIGKDVVARIRERQKPASADNNPGRV